MLTFRRLLRNESTSQERMLWARLRDSSLGVKFRRQHSVGRYVLDFYCPKLKLAVELDGSQHAEQERKDEERTAYLSINGIKVLRFWNNEVNTNIEGVMEMIYERVQDALSGTSSHSPHPSPPLEGEGVFTPPQPSPKIGEGERTPHQPSSDGGRGRRDCEMLAKVAVLVVFVSTIFGGVTFANAQTESFCSPDGYTIFTLNGVFTDEKGARDNMNRLKKEFDSNYKNEALFFDYLHNPSHLGGLGDILKSVVQKLKDNRETRDYDLIEMMVAASRKARTQKILLVAHSQGNFYANSFYDVATNPYLTEDGEEKVYPASSLGVYSVANPSGRVAGGGEWLTSDTDKVIAGLVGSVPVGSIMPPNTSIDLSNASDSLGHSFSDIYLRYRGVEIVRGIQRTLDGLRPHPNPPLNQGRESSPQSSTCLYAPDRSGTHTAKGVGYAILDPTMDVAKSATVGTVVLAHKTGEVVGDAAIATAVGTVKVAHKTGVIVGDAGLYLGKLALKGTKLGLTTYAKLKTSAFSPFPFAPFVFAQQSFPTLTSSVFTVFSRDKESGTLSIVGETDDLTKAQKLADETPPQPSPKSGEGVVTPPQPSPKIGEGERIPSQLSPQPTEERETVIVKTADADIESRIQMAEILMRASETAEGLGRVLERMKERDEDERKGESGDEVKVDNDESVSGSGGAVVIDLEDETTRKAVLYTQSFGGGGAGGGSTTPPPVVDEEPEPEAENEDETPPQPSPNEGEGDEEEPEPEEEPEAEPEPDPDPLTTPTLSISNCEQSLDTDASQCFLFATDTLTLSLSWDDAGEGSTYHIYDGENELASTETDALTYQHTLPEGDYSLTLTARRGEESATSSPITITITNSPPVVINEVAWMGMFGKDEDGNEWQDEDGNIIPSPNLITHEWIELYNTTARTISLSSITLSSSVNSFSVAISGNIPPDSYFLIERGTDQVVSDIPADQIYGDDTSAFNLDDNGDTLYLKIGSQIMDQTPQRGVPECDGWCGGTVQDSESMERIDPHTTGTEPTNWNSNNFGTTNGIDAEGEEIFGTPRATNSIKLPSPGGCIGACTD
ncbi:MAG: hypothetical protein COV07_03245 [Candidatus Vogelbacteria bacterium CG10_big_fil_rev_8_21_14_0_10_45_14]|uniref:LTD domain-containing protein n=1 Tax=Candidatus Vogelbacteria bacterium CG10_big_fil_rev_8_21_14_0_10_45_14 TaxID=1975042 RepID=A0A2H0RJL6_9BACT|nr:MAG: hypothetical protein COV07_03245 [Candidatus Vogelbacteria bacterium CG10_big_fil_rev_8_21_14_0_10_45_14]